MSFSVGLQCPNEHCTCHNVKSYSSWFTAGEHGDLKRIEELLNHPLRPRRVNQLDQSGYTCLSYAAQHGHTQVVSYLLRKGAEPDKNTSGATPLHRAAYNGHFNVCRLLLEHGAQVNAQDESFRDQRTPLHKAIDQDQLETVKVLFQYRADPFIVDSTGHRALDLVRSDPMLHFLQQKTSCSIRKVELSVVRDEKPSKNIDTGALISQQDVRQIRCTSCDRLTLSVKQLSCCEQLVCIDCGKHREHICGSTAKLNSVV